MRTLGTTSFLQNIHYDDRGQGTPLLLMHAFPLDSSMFEPQPFVRLITFDAPGAGKSPAHPGPAAIDDIADQAASLLDHLKVERAVVGGVSMGGYAAFGFARRHADRLLGLVLCDTRPSADSPQARQARYEMIEVVRRDGPAEITRRMIPRLLGETTRRENPALVERVRRTIESQPAEGIAALLDALANRRDSTDFLERIRVPTLVVVGEEDEISTPAETEHWSSRIAHSRLVKIPRAGHLPSLEQPQLFYRAVKDFVAIPEIAKA